MNAMDNLIREPASYRDAAGYIVTCQDNIYRVVTEHGLERYSQVRKTSIIDELIKKTWLLNESIVPTEQVKNIGSDAKIILQHPKIPFISYPYEWTFSALKQAALKHLQIQILALKQDVSLVDASAYNIQFMGANPVFIDHLSFAPYQTGEYWIAHQQFCEEFLNPLLLKAYCDIDFNDIYRGSNKGVTTEIIATLLPFKKKLNINMLLNVILPAHYDKKAKQKAIDVIKRKPFSKNAYLNMLMMLSSWISKLKIDKKQTTNWQQYAKHNHYQDEAKQEKHRFIEDFVTATKPKMLWDIGCNSGDFSIAALNAGAAMVVGLDSDIGALEKAYCRASKQQLNFLPLYVDLTNPSAAQGWAGIERKSLTARGPLDGLLALAVVHHLALANNLPLAQIISYLLQLAPKGVVEFVPKQDPMIKKMLSIKGDIFPDYNYQNFIDLLSQQANIIKTQVITEHGRVLIWFEK